MSEGYQSFHSQIFYINIFSLLNTKLQETEKMAFYRFVVRI